MQIVFVSRFQKKPIHEIKATCLMVLFGINMLNNSLTGIENMSKMVSPDTDTAKFLNTFSLHFNIVVPAKQN